MIQRIQSFYLFLTAVSSVLFLKGKLLSFIDTTGSEIRLTLTGIFRYNGDQILNSGESTFPFIVLIPAILILSLGTIFVFKKRRLQLWLTGSVIFLVLLLIFLETFYALHIINEFDCRIIPGFNMCIPLLLLILTFLAFRGIRKDEQLVRSYDRLR